MISIFIFHLSLNHSIYQLRNKGEEKVKFIPFGLTMKMIAGILDENNPRRGVGKSEKDIAFKSPQCTVG